MTCAARNYSRVAVCLALFSNGCGLDYDNPLELVPTGGVQGTVVSAALRPRDPTPVLGAICTVEGTNRRVSTNDQGRFEILDLEVGSYILICRENQSEDGGLAYLFVVEIEKDQVTDLGQILITPTGSIAGSCVLDEATDHSGIEIVIPGTSMQATSDANGSFVMTGVPAGTYELRYDYHGYQPQTVSGIEVGSNGQASVPEVTLSASTGVVGSILIAGGAAHVTDPQVEIAITVDSEATVMVLSESLEFLDATWQPVASKVSWQLEGDGSHTVFAKFADASGLSSLPTSDSILLDTQPPTGTIEIYDRATMTSTAEITLCLQASDGVTSVAEVLISGDPALTGASWQPYQETGTCGGMSVDWTLDAGDGTKTVYARFRDGAGHVSDIVSRSIELVVLTAIDVGMGHTCALRTSGKVVCWGSDSSGEASPPDGSFTQVRVGRDHSCALASDGSVTCWGSDTYGESTPPTGVFQQLGAGNQRTCGIRDDGSIECWGESWTDTSAPAGVFSELDLAYRDACALQDGTASCWGSYRPRVPPSQQLTHLAVGSGFVCGLLASDSTVVCRSEWEDDPALEDGGIELPTPPAGVFTQLSAGDLVCGLASDSSVQCWNMDPLRQDRETVPVAGAFTEVSVEGPDACALTTEGSVTCWGFYSDEPAMPPF